MCLAGRHVVWRAGCDYCLLLCSWCNNFVRSVRQGVLCCDLSDVRSEYCKVLLRLRDMDKLSESQRASIAKMSDERLQIKLSKAGYTPDLLIQCTRSDLMKAVAEVMIAEDEQQAAAAARGEMEEGVEDRPTEMERMAEVTDDMEKRRML